MATTANTTSVSVESTANAATPAAKKPVSAKPAAKKPDASRVAAKAAPGKAQKSAVKLTTNVAVPKAEKVKKVKLVRDSLSIPKDEFEMIGILKLRAGKLGHAAKKTEIIRAGIKAVAALSDQALLKALQAVPSIKTGRPAQTKGK